MDKSLADDIVGAAALLEWDEPLGIAFYPDHTVKADLIARMRALAPPREVVEIRHAKDALSLVERDALVIVDPESERAAISFFDRNRDHFIDGTARFLILLLRGGRGELALKDAPALASFARQASFEITAPPHRREMRIRFEQCHGIDPEDWLRRWREGTFPDTLENNHVLGEALTLTDLT